MHDDNDEKNTRATQQWAAREAAYEAMIEQEKKARQDSDEKYNQQLQQLQQLQQTTLALEVAKSKHTHDSIPVDEKEQAVAIKINSDFSKLLTSVSNFCDLDSTKLGMLEYTDLLPNKTTDEGYMEIKKDIETKTTDLQKSWKRIISNIGKLQKRYKGIQSLRHKKVKYKRKHTAATKKKDSLHKAREELKKSKYDDPGDDHNDDPSSDIDFS